MSGDHYHIRNQNAIYFLTFTVIDWVDVLTRREYRLIITDSLNHCIKEKGLTVFSWVIMSNHMHLIVKAKEGSQISAIIRDFKKYTAKMIIAEMHNISESRIVWIKKKMLFAGNRLNRISKYKFWRDDNCAKELDGNDILEQKLNYIHLNPVKALIVERPEQYIFSSAKDYNGTKGLVNIEILL